MKRIAQAFLFLCPVLLLGSEKSERVATVNPEHVINRLAFGSCLKNPSGGAIIDHVIRFKPDAFVWLGDNVYIDTNKDKTRFTQEYSKLGANPRFIKLRETCPTLAIWDDHDYGKQ